VALRWPAPVVAAAVLLASVAGLGISSVLLLVAIVAGGARLIETVGAAAEGRGDRLTVALSTAALVCLVAAGATHVVWLVAGLFACVAIELLGRPDVAVELPAEAAGELRRAA
jgi:hypothetical protein